MESEQSPQLARRLHCYTYGLPIISICFLTFNSTLALVRAHSQHDYPTIVYVMLAYFGFLVLLGCLSVLDRLPKYEESRRKICLKVAIWLMATTLNFAIAFVSAPVLHPNVALFVISVAAVSSFSGLYFIFVYRWELETTCYCNENVAYFESLPLAKDISPLELASPLDNV